VFFDKNACFVDQFCYNKFKLFKESEMGYISASTPTYPHRLDLP
jgi:hypothetical protein